MTTPARTAWLALLAVTVGVGPAAAQSSLPRIERARIGMPLADGGRVRAGAWAPVAVTLKTGSEGFAADTYQIVVEAVDAEDATLRVAAPVPGLGADAEYFTILYTRPAAGGCVVSVQTTSGQPVGDARVTLEARDLLEPQQSLYVTVGDRLDGLRRALRPADQELPENDGADDPKATHRVSTIGTGMELPDRWYGYDMVDVVVVPTADEAFVNRIPSGRKRALGEWVQRGGTLVVSIGRKPQVAKDFLDGLSVEPIGPRQVVNCAIEGTAVRLALPVLTRWSNAGQNTLGQTELAVLRPNKPVNPAHPVARADDVQTLVRETAPGEGGEELPIVVQSGYGRGRIVLVAFDFDAKSFASWVGQRGFWERLDSELLPRPALDRDAEEARPRNAAAVVDLNSELHRDLEGFKEVPVISFAWVALFIVIYIALVGPLDYLVLKKVFKRLEFTWITFPTVVVLVSAASYYAAYKLKGEDLRFNKIDIVEYDLHNPNAQAYGETWLTLFSPTIKNYTVGHEPNTPTWADASQSKRDSDRMVLTTFDSSERGGLRTGSQGLFRRPYRYVGDASTLEDVAVPVWATRTFAASWRAPIRPGQAPIDADFRLGREANSALLGRITNRLPVELRDANLLYRGKRYPVGVVPALGSVPIEPLRVGGGEGAQVVQWLGDVNALGNAGGVASIVPPRLIKDLLFHGAPAQVVADNGGWRRLDESWRLRPTALASPRPQAVTYRDEVLLVARVPSRAGSAEVVTADVASPTRLWLGERAAPGRERPTVPGYMSQDVYLRVYIPVNP